MTDPYEPLPTSPPDPNARKKLGALVGLVLAIIVVGRNLVDEDAPRSPTLEALLPRRGLSLDLAMLTLLADLDESGAGRVPALELAAGRGDDTSSLVAFRGDLYWTAARRRVVSRTPAAGGATVELTHTSADPYSLAVDAAGVHGLTASGELLRVGLDGGAATTLGTGFRGAHGIAVDEDGLYVTDEAGGRVLRIAKEGGPALLVAVGQSRPLDVVTDGENVYWTNTFDGAVMSAPRWGGPPTRVAEGQKRAHGIAVDATHVYWVTPRAVRRAPILGGPVEPLFDGLRFGWAIQVSAGHAIVAVPDSGAVIAVPIAGGPPRLVAARRGKPEALAADGEHVYWIDESGGALYRAPIPR